MKFWIGFAFGVGIVIIVRILHRRTTNFNLWFWIDQLAWTKKGRISEIEKEDSDRTAKH